MAEKSSADLSVELAQKLQERFETYLVGLIFTLLGLSIQTAKFGVAAAADVLEILGWLLLFVAGLAGLSRFEWLPEFYRLDSIRHEKEEAARAVERAMLQGTTEVYVAPLKKSVPAAQYASEAQASAQLVADKLKPIERREQRKYRLMKWSFVLALALLIGARAYVPVAALVTKLVK